MKTSFYFVVWILIYPLLALFDNSFINENSFFVAIAVVIGLTWLINKTMSNTLLYENASRIAPILEDVYTGNISSFGKRLTRDTLLEIVTAAYFLVTTALILLVMINYGARDWFSLLVFGFFAISAISRSYVFNKARTALNRNPTPQQCMEIAEETYKLDYASYYEERQRYPYEDALPPRPRFYKVFLIFSLLMAVIATLLGVIFIVRAAILSFALSGVTAQALAGMYFLYGSLATYFGVKDLVSIIRSFKSK